MPRYKLADVVLDVSGIEKAKLFCPPRTVCWLWHTPCWWHSCHHPMITWCRPIRTTIWYEVEQQVCPGGSILDLEHIFDEWDDPRELEGLKVQLRTTLEKLEKHQEVLARQMQPQTLDEVKALEEQMKAAAAALAARKRELGG